MAIFVAVGLIAAVLWLGRSQAASHIKGEPHTATVEQRLLSDQNVLWVSTFEDSNWRDLWGFGTFNHESNISVNTFGSNTDQGKALRGRTVAGQANGFGGHANFVNMGPGSGAGIAEQEEAYLRYRVNFPTDYVWVNPNDGGHGKLPGLAGKATGGADWAVSAGGRRWNGTTAIKRLEDLGTADGWSARLLWQKDMGASVYLYAPNQYGRVTGTPGTDSFRAFGRAVRLKVDPYNSSSSNMKFNTGWNTIEQYVKMNTPGQANGELKIWMNGKLGLHMTNVMYRSSQRPNLKITQIFWSWFYGGPQNDYPHKDSYIYFDDVVISKAPIGPRTDEPPADRPDLVVTDVSWSPSSPRAGEPIRFSATIKNQGSAPTPADTIHGVAFSIDGKKYTWSDDSTASLAPGASRTLTANGGISGHTDGTWLSTASGTFTLEAWVDDATRITESDEGNNKLSRSFSVTAADKPGDVNGDGSINGTDLNIVLTNYGKTGQTRSQGDLNSDGTVNSLDLSIVLSKYGT